MQPPMNKFNWFNFPSRQSRHIGFCRSAISDPQSNPTHGQLWTDWWITFILMFQHSKILHRFACTGSTFWAVLSVGQSKQILRILCARHLVHEGLLQSWYAPSSIDRMQQAANQIGLCCSEAATSVVYCTRPKSNKVSSPYFVILRYWQF